MAIESKIKDRNKGKAIDFPLLMESEYSIVKMTERKTGTVYHVKGNNHYKVGYHSTDWAMDNFEPFTGVLELSNK